MHGRKCYSDARLLTLPPPSDRVHDLTSCPTQLVPVVDRERQRHVEEVTKQMEERLQRYGKSLTWWSPGALSPSLLIFLLLVSIGDVCRFPC